jgi:hypothetical protein
VRGCLSVLVLAATFIVGGAWFGGPTLAGAVVQTGLVTAGLDAVELKVGVEADPPVEAALGRADRVTVDARNLVWNGLRARSLDLVLRDVDLVARTAATADGTLSGVALPNVEPAGSEADVEIHGPADGATATVTIDGAAVEAMAVAAFEAKLGRRPDRASLSAPNVIRLRSGGIEIVGAITVGPDGSIGVTTPLGTATIAAADPSLPIRLASAAVEDGDLVLTGTLDVESLMRG